MRRLALTAALAGLAALAAQAASAQFFYAPSAYPELQFPVTSGSTYAVTYPNAVVCAQTGAALNVIPMANPPLSARLVVKDCNVGSYGLYALTMTPTSPQKVDGASSYPVVTPSTAALSSGASLIFDYVAVNSWGVL